MNRKGGWMLNAALKPKSKFLGNSAASIMDGKGTLHNLVHSISQLPDPRRRRNAARLRWLVRCAGSPCEMRDSWILPHLSIMCTEEVYEITYPSLYVRGLLIG